MENSPGDYIILSHTTGNRIVLKRDSFEMQRERRVFQIAYDHEQLEKRAGLLKKRGHQITSVMGNDAAIAALTQGADYDLIVVGHSAPENLRTEICGWIKIHHPQIPILALNPPFQRQLTGADYNLVLNGPEEWLLVVETASN
jgi:CheY-like chemotaxis protein